MGHVMDALTRLDSMAAAGRLLGEVNYKAEAIAAGWWWNADGDLTQAGRPREAEDAARWAVALDHAQQALRVYA